MFRTFCLPLVVAVSLVAFERDALSQSPELRYQLGRRLSRFERQWQTADETARARSTPKMMSAVTSFFSLQLDTAITKLDEAWLAVEGNDDMESEEAISDAGWFVVVRPLLLDSDARSLSLSLQHQPLSIKSPSSSTPCDLTISIIDAKGMKVREQRWPSVSNMDAWSWEMEPLSPGDYHVTASLHRGSKVTDVIANRFSVVSDVAKRIEQVRALVTSRRNTVSDTKSLSIQSMARMIIGGQDGRIAESDFPFESLISDVELLAEDKSTVREFISSRPERSIWLQLGNGKSKQTVRLQTASNPSGAPLVVAFHGAGGSENMFFESYGAGALIDHCRQKGWSVISTRQGMMGAGMELDAMLDELRLHLDFDVDRVYLIGHSMGAAQAVAQVSKHPTRVRAVAAIGGGGRPAESEELKRVPFFVAAGEKDFGLSQARSLSDILRALGAEVDDREVKDVEHMVIVQATLNDVVSFFEKQK